jgi:hypothetical protein
MLGLPLMVAIIGGEPRRFRPLVDLYPEAGRRAGHSSEQLKAGIHALGYVADSDQQAADEFFPGYARSFTEIGKERGWPPTTRRQFDACLSPKVRCVSAIREQLLKKFTWSVKRLAGSRDLVFK